MAREVHADIEFVGHKALNDKEKAELVRLSEEYAGKISRIAGISKIIVHIKTYAAKDEKKRRKYSIHCKVQMPGQLFEGCKAHDWDIATALHKSFNDVIKQVQKHVRKGLDFKARRP